MKYVRLGIFTMIVIFVELVLSYFLAAKFHYRLLDMMFYVGLFFSLFFVFFSSTGGLPTNYSEIQVAGSYMGIKDNYKFKRTFGSLSVNSFVLGSILFFIMGFLISFIY